MSIFDKMFGHEEQPKQQPAQQPQPPQQQYQNQAPPPLTDEQAIARYRYMLKTAPPETIEQAHQESFAQLTPQQRQLVLQQLTDAVPPSERPPASAANDPQALARAATRAEVRQPGTLERLFGGSGAAAPGGAVPPGGAAAPGGGSGLGMGSVIGGSLLTSLAGGFIGSAIADHFFNNTAAGRGFGGGGFGGGGGGFGGGGFGGPEVINETTNIYEGGGRDPEDRSSSAASNDDSVDDSSDDSSDDSVDDATDDSGDDSSIDDSGSDDSGSFDDGGSYDDGGGSDDV
jgi:hypothetical protein